MNTSLTLAALIVLISSTLLADTDQIRAYQEQKVQELKEDMQRAEDKIQDQKREDGRQAQIRQNAKLQAQKLEDARQERIRQDRIYQQKQDNARRWGS